MVGNSHIRRLFECHSLGQQNLVPLLRRQEQKFLLPLDHLVRLLPLWRSHYSVLEHSGTLLQPYHSLYLDSADNRCYFDHHTGRLPRFKCRWRVYENDGGVYFEIKQKLKPSETLKFRVPVDHPGQWTADCEELLGRLGAMPVTNWQPSLSVRYQRFTLLNLTANQRVTVDQQIHVSGPERGTRKAGLLLAPWAVVEVKSLRQPGNSLVAKSIREAGWPAHAVSKYSLGRALLDPSLKQNAYKPILRRLWRLQLQPEFSAMFSPEFAHV